MQKTEYFWHPVFKLVKKIKDEYLSSFGEETYDLHKMLISLNKEEYNRIFDCIDVTQYEEFALFKYKSFIELADLDIYRQDNFWEINECFFQECRSFVMDLKRDAIVLAPQKKFFNINERNGWMLSEIREKILQSDALEISSKLDGSNQNARWYNGKIFISGASALDRNLSWRLSETEKFLTKEYENMMQAYPSWTFMFEYISPKNQVVVYYPPEMEGLYLFGMRNVYTGEEKSYQEVLRIGKFFKVKTTDVFDKTLDDILSEVDSWKGSEKEGWVINIINKSGNFKAKLKVNDYVLIHRFIAKLISPNAVIQAIIEGKFDDLISKVPEGSKDLALQYATEVIQYVDLIKKRVNEYVKIALEKESVKEAMIWIDRNVPKEFLGYVKSEYLGKEWNCLKKSGDGHKKIGEIQKIIEHYKGDKQND